MTRAWIVVALLTVLSAGTAHADGPPPRPFGGVGSGDDAWRALAAREQYEAQKKNPWAALGLEVVVPGLGSYYADAWEDAALTWAGLAIGALFLLDAYTPRCRTYVMVEQCPNEGAKLATGWVFLVGSRLYGLTRAPLSALTFNEVLRIRLGLTPPGPLVLAPWAGQGGTGFALHMVF